MNDYDLREATHEQAVHRIKNATNPVKFVVQSLHCFSPQHVRPQLIYYILSELNYSNYLS